MVTFELDSTKSKYDVKITGDLYYPVSAGNPQVEDISGTIIVTSEASLVPIYREVFPSFYVLRCEMSFSLKEGIVELDTGSVGNVFIHSKTCIPVKKSTFVFFRDSSAANRNQLQPLLLELGFEVFLCDFFSNVVVSPDIAKKPLPERIKYLYEKEKEKFIALVSRVWKNKKTYRITVELTEPYFFLDKVRKHIINIGCRNPTSNIFRYGNRLASIQDSTGLLDIWSKSNYLNYLGRYFKFVQGGEVLPPASWIDFLLSADWGSIPQVVALTKYPCFNFDSGKICRDGLDSSGIYVKYSRNFENIEGLDLVYKPIGTKSEARAFVDFLLYDLLYDFPFDSEESRSAYFAALVTPLLAFDVTSCYPMFLIDGTTPGVGKSLLGSLIFHMLGEQPAPIMLSAGDEFRKALLAMLMSGKSLFLFDNVSYIKNSTLEAVLTSPIWQDRILGSSSMWRGPLRFISFATGNNVLLYGDIYRRTVKIRLLAREELPYQKKAFRYPNIISIFKQTPIIERLLECLVLFKKCNQTYFYKGIKLGSFENWSVAVLGLIDYLGLPLPVLDTTADNIELSSLRQLLMNWHKIDPRKEGLTVSEIVKFIQDPKYIDIKSLLEVVCGSCNSKSIGIGLKRFEGRIVDRLCLKYTAGKWFVEDASKAKTLF